MPLLAKSHLFERIKHTNSYIKLRNLAPALLRNSTIAHYPLQRLFIKQINIMPLLSLFGSNTAKTPTEDNPLTGTELSEDIYIDAHIPSNEETLSEAHDKLRIRPVETLTSRRAE
jgi:hypothetical protein